MESVLPAPSLIVLVGPSSSGKSSWADTHFSPSEIVSSDDLRARVGADETDRAAGTAAFEILDAIVRERLRRGLTTVVDTTGLDAPNRERWLAMAAASSVPAYAIVFPTDLETCLERNDQRRSRRPRSVVRDQHRRMAETLAQLAAEPFVDVIEQRPVRLASPTVAAASVAVVTPEEADPPRSEHTYGLMLSRFDWDDSEPRATLRDIAVRAERAGFRDIWLMDHLRQIQSVGRAWEDILEPFTALAAIAGATETIRVGCLVSPITHRHPAVLANTIASLDVLSGGRANCGLGIGWDREEHEAYGIDFPATNERYERLEETIEYLRAMWGKGAPAFDGTYYHGKALACYPRPVQRKIPILVGGSGETRTLRLVARFGDAANVFGPPERVAHKHRVLQAHCEAVGRDVDEIEMTHLVNALAAPDPPTLRLLVDEMRPPGTSHEAFLRRHNGGVAEDLRAMFASYHRSGATHSIIAVPSPHLPGVIEHFAGVISE